MFDAGPLTIPSAAFLYGGFQKHIGFQLDRKNSMRKLLKDLEMLLTAGALCVASAIGYFDEWAVRRSEKLLWLPPVRQEVSEPEYR
jgi:hypothetical protein